VRTELAIESKHGASPQDLPALLNLSSAPWGGNGMGSMQTGDGTRLCCRLQHLLKSHGRAGVRVQGEWVFSRGPAI
jgi:hypothetical protein